MPRVRAKIKISRKIQNILLKSASENVALDYNWMNNCETLSHFILLFVNNNTWIYSGCLALADLWLSNRATEQSGMPGCPVGGSSTQVLPRISTRQPSLGTPSLGLGTPSLGLGSQA